MALTPIFTFANSQLQPARDPRTARMYNVNLLAGTYVRGQCIGEVTNVGANAVQTLTTTGTVTGGSVILTGQPISYGYASTYTMPWNATVAQIQAGLDLIYGPGNTRVSGTALPAGTVTITFTGALSSQVVPAITQVASLTGTTPVLVITQTTTGVANVGNFGAYANGNSDGTQVVKAILQYACTVDASGNVTISAEIPGFTEKAVPAYYRGTFRCEELVGLPTAGNLAVDFPGARVAVGTLASGLLVLA